jgi:hypothetical protein
MSKMRRMWILVLALLLLGAHLNLSALVPLQVGDPVPPWWVGGRLIWPFAEDTNTLLSEETTNAITPMMSIASALCFLLAAAALLRWRVPGHWFLWLIVAAAVLSIVLQVIWFTEWAMLPLLVDAALLWAVFRMRVTVDILRG